MDFQPNTTNPANASTNTYHSNNNNNNNNNTSGLHVTSTVRFATPPVRSRSLVSSHDNEDATPLFSVLLTQDHDTIQALQRAIDGEASPDRYPPSPLLAAESDHHGDDSNPFSGLSLDPQANVDDSHVVGVRTAAVQHDDLDYSGNGGDQDEDNYDDNGETSSSSQIRLDFEPPTNDNSLIDPDGGDDDLLATALPDQAGSPLPHEEARNAVHRMGGPNRSSSAFRKGVLPRLGATVITPQTLQQVNKQRRATRAKSAAAAAPATPAPNVTADNIAAIRGICKAQSLVRGYLARTRARKQLLINAWHELDAKEEQELAQSHRSYENLRTMVDDHHLQQHRAGKLSLTGGGSDLGSSTSSTADSHAAGSGSGSLIATTFSTGGGSNGRNMDDEHFRHHSLTWGDAALFLNSGLLPRQHLATIVSDTSSSSSTNNHPSLASLFASLNDHQDQQQPQQQQQQQQPSASASSFLLPSMSPSSPLAPLDATLPFDTNNAVVSDSQSPPSIIPSSAFLTSPFMSSSPFLLRSVAETEAAVSPLIDSTAATAEVAPVSPIQNLADESQDNLSSLLPTTTAHDHAENVLPHDPCDNESVQAQALDSFLDSDSDTLSCAQPVMPASPLPSALPSDHSSSLSQQPTATTTSATDASANADADSSINQSTAYAPAENAGNVDELPPSTTQQHSENDFALPLPSPDIAPLVHPLSPSTDQPTPNNNNNNNNSPSQPLSNFSLPNLPSLSQPPASSLQFPQQPLYLPPSGLSWADDAGRVSLTDLNLPKALGETTSVYGDCDEVDNDWSERVITRLAQLRLLREFRKVSTYHTATTTNEAASDHCARLESMIDDLTSIDESHSATAAAAAAATKLNLGSSGGSLNSLTAERMESEFFYNQASGFHTRLDRKVTRLQNIPRANLRPVTTSHPIDIDWVMSLCDELAKGLLPPTPTVERLILLTYSILCKEPNVKDVTVPPNGKITIVGDIHGQLDDLLSIFRLNGVPSGANLYIFNGDWVDRGNKSIEVILIIMAWKIVSPNFVFLNRGNHEATDINSRDGFERECHSKYGFGMFPLFSELFSSVPIATRVFGSESISPENEKASATSTSSPTNASANPPPSDRPKPAIFVTHGGIPCHNVTIADIQAENRFHNIPLTNSLHYNMLWSDPSPYKGTAPSSRGAGYEFGPDVTLDFLRRNSCCMLIRSHECMQGGWALAHHNMCLTVFSASNYCGVVGNQGAYCIIESSLRPTLVTYYAEHTEQLSVSSTIRFKRLESMVIRKLKDRIAMHRLDLISHYRQTSRDNLDRLARGEHVDLDTNAAIPCSDQVISRQQWADGLRHVLGVNIPFRLFQEQLGLPSRGVLGDERGPINYMTFLVPFMPKFSLLQNMRDAAIQTDVDVQTRQNPHSDQSMQVLAHAHAFDSVAPGAEPDMKQPLATATTDAVPPETADASTGSIHALSYGDAKTIANAVSPPHTHHANYPLSDQIEFLIKRDAQGEIIFTDVVARISLTQLAQLLYSHRYELSSVFRFLDYDNTGGVSRQEFVIGIFSLITLFQTKVAKMRTEQHPHVDIYAQNAALLLDISWDYDKLYQLAVLVDPDDDCLRYDEFLDFFSYDAQSHVSEHRGLGAPLVHSAPRKIDLNTAPQDNADDVDTTKQNIPEDNTNQTPTM